MNEPMHLNQDLDGTEIRASAATIAVVVGSVVGAVVAWSIWHTSGHISRMTFDRVEVSAAE